MPHFTAYRRDWKKREEVGLSLGWRNWSPGHSAPGASQAVLQATRGARRGGGGGVRRGGGCLALGYFKTKPWRADLSCYAPLLIFYVRLYVELLASFCP